MSAKRNTLKRGSHFKIMSLYYASFITCVLAKVLQTKTLRPKKYHLGMYNKKH
jgi:hypothetical protein